MTDTTDSARSQQPHELRAEVRNWCEAWKTCFQNVLSQVSGEPNVFELSAQPLPVADSDLWYTVAAAGAVQGEMTLRLPLASANCLARNLLGEPEATAPAEAAQSITAENKEALEELLRQVAGLAATALASTAAGEVQLRLVASGAPSWSSHAVVSLRARSEAGAGAAIALEIQISPALAAKLQPSLQPRAEPAPGVPSSASSPTPPPSSYRRLMDVGLGVKLRFGTRRMLLRDVLALSAGVVVELDNTLNSPVDLLLDGRLIAQGEVVVVDGKYGLRITGVVDPAPAAGAFL